MYSSKTSVKKPQKNNQNLIEALNTSSLTQPSNLSERSQVEEESSSFEKSKKLPQRKEFTIFNYAQYYEQELVRKQIQELVEAIRQEIVLIKKTDQGLINEVKDIEKITIDNIGEKTGIYHVRFLEIVLRLLRSLRQKVSESKTWLSAMISRKKKRGSLFAVLSKKKGTQYSLSQELQTARSVQ